MSLAAVLLLFTVAALAVALLPVHARNGVAAIAGAAALAGLIGLALRFPEVRDGGVSVTRIAWVPSLGLELVLRLDGLTWMFGVLVLGIGALVDPVRALLPVARRTPSRGSSPSCSRSSPRCWGRSSPATCCSSRSSGS